MLAVVNNVKLSKNQNKKNPLPYAMKDFSEFIKKHNINPEEMLHNFGCYLEKSQDEQMKNILRNLIGECCTFYRMRCVNKQNLTTCNSIYAKINLPFPNNIVWQVLDEVKDMKAGKKTGEYNGPFGLQKTFDDGINIIPEQDF